LKQEPTDAVGYVAKLDEIGAKSRGRLVRAERRGFGVGDSRGEAEQTAE